MTVEFLDNGEIAVTGLSKIPDETATDGIYIPARQFAMEQDIPEGYVRLLKRRGNIEAISILGHIFVKKGSKILKRRVTDLTL